MGSMRSRRYVLLGMLCLGISSLFTPVQAQVMKLEGRRFMLDGEEFRPRVVNYSMEMVVQSWSNRNDPSFWFMAPASEIFNNYAYGFGCSSVTTCKGKMLEHFTWMVEHGFNTVRLVHHVSPSIDLIGDTAQSYEVFLRGNNPSGWFETEFGLEAPAFTDAHSLRYFSLLHEVMSAAEEAGIKVILLCLVGGRNTNCAVDQDAVDLYSAYLARLAGELREEPALMAYDIWNEPGWSKPDYQMLSHSKAEVCAMTTQWYDTLKAHDPDHLVTLGGADIMELGSWDPAVMKLDFYMPHFYPEFTMVDGYDVGNIIDRAVAEEYWIGSSCPIPWVIGETSFSANNDTVDDINYPNRTFLDADPAHHRYPWMDGSEAQQAEYALAVSDATYAYHGSGFGWWAFKDSHGTWIEKVNASPTDGNTERSYSTCFFGIQHYGQDMNDPNVGKSMVGALMSHVPPMPTNELPPPPAAYYNWHALPETPTAEYELLDQNDEPISNALFEVSWVYPFDGSGNGSDQTLWNRTPTHNDGSVTIWAAPTVAGYGPPQRRALAVNGSGCSSAYIDADNWPASGSPISLARDYFPFAKSFDGVFVGINAYADLKARGRVEVTNTTIEGNGVDDGGAANLHAREWVHVGSEFHAQKGAEIHIYISDTWPDSCNSAAHRSVLVEQAPSAAQARQRSDPEQAGQRLSLQFEKPPPRLSITPNPFTDQVQVSTDAEAGIYTILDAQGRLVHRASFSSPVFVLSTATFAPGEYVLRVEGPGGVQSTTISKQP